MCCKVNSIFNLVHTIYDNFKLFFTDFSKLSHCNDMLSSIIKMLFYFMVFFVIISQKLHNPTDIAMPRCCERCACRDET